MEALEIGTTSKDGLVQITDTSWDGNGTLLVTVRELIGGFDGWIGGKARAVRKMRDFARRALPEYYDGQTVSVKVIRTWTAQGGSHATFAVSRNA